MRRLQKSGAKPEVAIALAVAILLTAIAVLLTLIVTRLSDQFQELFQLVPLGIEQLRVWSNWLQARLPGQIFDNLPSIDDLTQEIKTLFRWTSSHIYLLFSNYLSLIINTLLIIYRFDNHACGKSDAIPPRNYQPFSRFLPLASL